MHSEPFAPKGGRFGRFWSDTRFFRPIISLLVVNPKSATLKLFISI